jgi:CRP-like cAMP-binding protein
LSESQVIFHTGEAADTIYIVERGIVASHGHLLAPGGVLGLALYVMGSSSGGGADGADRDERSRVWDHTARTLAYANLLTLPRRQFAR